MKSQTPQKCAAQAEIRHVLIHRPVGAGGERSNNSGSRQGETCVDRSLATVANLAVASRSTAVGGAIMALPSEPPPTGAEAGERAVLRSGELPDEPSRLLEALDPTPHWPWWPAAAWASWPPPNERRPDPRPKDGMSIVHARRAKGTGGGTMD